MDCYFWELEAILEGLTLKKLDEKEEEALMCFNLRYVLNAKKPKLNKIFNKKKLEDKVSDAFHGNAENDKPTAEKVRHAMNYFKNKKWG
ncbi:hypothetical protein [Enterococcus faecalis]|uniref:hypothetical protein n=1 Tax=Enterococcus faecalis TaxID=1351 RepID=UPI003D0CBD1B